MKLRVYFKIAIRLILLFGSGMLFTFFTPLMRDFFGDTLCVNCIDEYDSNYNWGLRHYWYFWLTLCLFILSLISAIMSIVNIIKKSYNIKVN